MASNEFGVVLTSTADYSDYLLSALGSLRTWNSAVPVSVAVRSGVAGSLVGACESLKVEIDQHDTDQELLDQIDPQWREWVDSRLLKIRVFVEAKYDPFLYVDSDILAQEDVDKLRVELSPALDSAADIFMLLRRPERWTLWGDRANYFRDREIGRAGILSKISDVFEIDLPERALDELECWNSGVVFGRAEVLQKVGRRWLELYKRQLQNDGCRDIVPRDQLALWLTLWEMGNEVRVDELPRNWNYMAGHFLGIAAGSAEFPENVRERISFLHLAQNKGDKWAIEMVAEQLKKLGIA